MAAGKNPSGLPRQRIVGPMWGPKEVDVYRRVGRQHAGLLRVRRDLLIAAGVLAAVAAIAAIAGETNIAFGIFAVILVPLLFIVVVLQVIVIVTRPNKTAGHPDAP